jgi:SAM-dependent methyltransferase
MLGSLIGAPRPHTLRRIVVWSGVAISAAVVGIAVTLFPYDVDAPVSAQELEKSRKYYAEAYRQSDPAGQQPLSAYETKYLQLAISGAKKAHVKEQVEALVNRYGLRGRPVLEIGSGRGYLQDIAEDYTGLDISPNVRRFYHKKFVLGSATALPFPDNSFDGAWSVWVFEHIPNPEQALYECRRVMRDGGVIMLRPAWNSTPWAANGYRVRPYSDFNLAGKLIKASVSIRSLQPFRAAGKYPARSIRLVASLFGGPTTLHYTRLTPNYTEYWESDSDAVNSLDRHETMLWFRSRGDECLNCEGAEGSIFMNPDEPWLIIRVHKRS